MDMLKDLLKKKARNDEIDPKYKSAKMSILQQISDMASQAMGDDLKGLKKVEVASSSSDGLKEGLAKAQEMVEKKGEPLHTDDMDNTAAYEADHPSSDEPEQSMTSEEIDAEIQELQAKKAKLLHK